MRYLCGTEKTWDAIRPPADAKKGVHADQVGGGGGVFWSSIGEK